MENEFLVCDGCGEKIFVGDENIDLKFDEEFEGLLIHKSIKCLLKLDGVSEGTVTEIKTLTADDIREQV